MRFSLKTKWIMTIAAFIVTPIIATTLGVGGGSASAQVVNYTGAVNAINAACASGLRMAHAAYGSNPVLNRTTGVVTYTLNVLWKRCAAGSVGEYAVTGYNGEACPVVGMYHDGWNGTRDCVKYSSRHNTMPECGAFRCIYRSVWNGYGIWKGADGGPGDYALHSAALGGRTVAISNWAAKRLTGGTENLFVARMCDYYSGVSNRLCQDTYVRVSWAAEYNFNLNPVVSASPTVVEPGAPIQVLPSMNNTGTTNSRPAQWQATTFNLAPGAAIPNPSGGLNATTPVTFYGNGATIIGQGTNVTFARGVTNLSAINRTAGDLPAGSKICFTLSVQPATHATTNWRHSAPFCVTIAKSPKVQVRSGDLIVGRGSATNAAQVSNVITGVTSKGGLFYGSWAEYAIVPTGVVTGMASGSGYVGGSVTGDLCSLSVLTFTLTGSGSGCGVIGNYSQVTVAPNVSARFPINVPAAAAGSGNPADPAVLPSNNVNLTGNNLSGHYQARAGATALTVSSSQRIPAGRWVVINAPEATVTINSNIQYTDAALNSLSDIPQVVIIARNIIISDAVTNIDAWLIAVGSGADGRINTCGAGGVTETSALTYTNCANQLVVNGPVMANHLIMRRTHGSGVGAESGVPAEIFNLRADAYIWATNYNLGSGRLSTIHTKELPPRF